MAFYTVYTPPPDPARPLADQLAETVFVKDGFSLFAFVFTGFWLLAKRLWLAFFVFLLIWAAIGFGGRWIGINPLALGLAQLLIGIMLGLEGPALIERKLQARGWRLAGVVEGRDLDAVERRFFEGALPSMQPAPSLPGGNPPQGLRMAQPAGVIGLFPDARGA